MTSPWVPDRLRQPNRQSPVAVALLALRVLRNIGIAQLAIAAAFLFNAGLSARLGLVATVGILALGGVGALAWWRFTFQVVGDDLVIQRGVVSLDRLVLPLDRIQSVEIEQPLLHRLVDLVKVSVDSAGSDGSEFVLDAVARDVADDLQRTAASHRRAVPADSDGAPPPPGVAVPDAATARDRRTLVRHAPGRLLRVGLTAWPLAGLVLLAPVFALGDEIGSFLPFDMPEFTADDLEWWFVPLGLVVFVAVSVVLNVVQTLLREWDLTITETDAGVRRRSGLLSRTSRASTLDRIQAVETDANPLQRSAGLSTVRLAVFGDGDVQVPGCDDEQRDLLRDLVLGREGVAPEPTRRVSPAEIVLAARNSLLMWLPPAVVLAVAWRPWGLALLLVPVVSTALRAVAIRRTRWGVGDVLVRRRPFPTLEVKELAIRKANAVTVQESFFERRRGLASVSVVVAGSWVHIGMVPIAEAEALRDLVLHRAETDPRPFM